MFFSAYCTQVQLFWATRTNSFISVYIVNLLITSLVRHAEPGTADSIFFVPGSSKCYLTVPLNGQYSPITLSHLCIKSTDKVQVEMGSCSFRICGLNTGLCVRCLYLVYVHCLIRSPISQTDNHSSITMELHPFASVGQRICCFCTVAVLML